MPRTLFISYLLLIKDRGFPYDEFIYLSILYLNKKRGFGVVTCISTFVPILYHIYKRLSSDLNTFFKNYLYYFLLLIKERGCGVNKLYINSITLLLIKERGFRDHTLSISLLIKERGCGVAKLYLILLLIKDRGNGGGKLLLFLLLIKERGFPLFQ